MKVDLRVEPDMLSDPNFLDELRKGCIRLSRPRAIKNTCIHEVGHLAYVEEVLKWLKCPFEIKAKLNGPDVEFHPGKNGLIYIFSSGSVSAPLSRLITNYSDELLQRLAKCAVAGAVYLEVLEKVKDDGDGFDKFNFECHHKRAEKQLGKLKKDVGDYLRDARPVVFDDIQEPEKQKQARKLAAEFETEFFTFVPS